MNDEMELTAEEFDILGRILAGKADAQDYRRQRQIQALLQDKPDDRDQQLQAPRPIS